MSGNVHYKIKMGSNSILRKLTASQIWRSIAFCFKINLAILVIAFIIMLCYVNIQAGRVVNLVGGPLSEGGYSAYIPGLEEIGGAGDGLRRIIREYTFYITRPELPEGQISAELGGDSMRVLEQLMGFQFYTSDQIPYSTGYPALLSRALGFPNGAFGRLELDQTLNFWEDGAYYTSDVHFKYLVILPTSGPQYAFLAFDLVPMSAVVLVGMGVLISFQFLLILFGSIGIRRTTKKLLRPISDLAAAARSINTAPNPQVKRQELRLDGAINTLNAITEEHLDRRISIDDEREELRGLASAINAMLDRLDAAYQAQLRFVSDASHELRTPIAVIQGYANLLDRWGKNDEKALQESIDAIKAEAHGMEGLVEQLLFLARSDSSTLKTDMNDVDISLLTEEIVKETAMIDEKHKITGDIDQGLMVYGDAQLLKQAVRIFVDNAIKYTPEGGRIKISGHEQADGVHISVSDTGIGIGGGDISQVFERFFRADESRTRKTGGTGLGLAIAKYIIDRHGGYMDVVSRENIGTKITAVIPIRNTQPQQPAPIPTFEVITPESSKIKRPKAV